MRRRRGLTLLEVVVALAITAAVLVVLQRALGDAVRADRTIAARVSGHGALRAALVHLVRELSAAEPGTLRLARPTAADPQVEFVVDEPAATVVRYRVVDERLERTAQPRFAIEPGHDAPAVLLEGVRAFELRARDTEGWHDTWNDARPPALVAIDLRLASGERFETAVTPLAGGRP